IPGIKQLSPADVMRGEETQIVGFLAQNPGFSGAICLPGTHTKWVEVADGAIRRFQTFMTGEIFNLLSKSSVLQHVIGAKGWDDTAFITGLNGSQKPTAQMFELRAAALLAGLSPIAARSQLSGHLIGAELGAVRPYWQDKKVVLIGDQALARAYQTALSHIGCHATIESGDTLVLAGLCAAMAMLEENGRGADHNS
ncbi:MAG: 2-dehydro-3-deoxygalactonokinase, partial [Rhodobacteraceae bacterium]|nr:2-dehydro-3-deoxygalactonokinase [Paracoccaceae bacterium]